MGMFLAISGIIGKPQAAVAESLGRYAQSVGGGLQQQLLSNNHKNFSVIEQDNNNTSIFYPDDFLNWDEASAFLSQDLNTPVFSFHIHDSDLWMYILYYKGEIIDQFNPVPGYWSDDITDEEKAAWKGNAAIIEQYVPGVQKESIEKYLVSWETDTEPVQAYAGDTFVQEDWQLLDFMKKLQLPYPLDDDGNARATGNVYALWTEDILLEPQKDAATATLSGTSSKPWWKFW